MTRMCLGKWCWRSELHLLPQFIPCVSSRSSKFPIPCQFLLPLENRDFGRQGKYLAAGFIPDVSIVKSEALPQSLEVKLSVDCCRSCLSGTQIAITDALKVDNVVWELNAMVLCCSEEAHETFPITGCVYWNQCWTLTWGTLGGHMAPPGV